MLLTWLRKIPLAAYLVVGGGTIGFLWLREHDARVRAEGKAETLALQIDSLRVLASDAHDKVAAKDSTVALQKLVIQTQQRQLEEVAVVARRQTQVAVASLRDQLDEQQKAMLDTITAGYERQLAARDSMFAAQVRLTTLANEQIAVRDSAYKALEQASSVVYDAWQVEKKRASPSTFKKALRAVPVVLGTLGIVALVD